MAFLGYLKAHAHIYTLNTATSLKRTYSIYLGSVYSPYVLIHKVIQGVKIEQMIYCYRNKPHLFPNCNRHQSAVAVQ